MTTELIAGLIRGENKRLDGAKSGLLALAPTLQQEMRDSPAHGDDTGAANASYGARVVGRGEDGSVALAQARSAASALNPEQVEGIQAVAIAGELGLIFDSPMPYSIYLETERAGVHQKIIPMVNQGQRYTQTVAQGMKKAMGG